ncbi:hypothetical protein BGZ96_000115 [Linnemannia gamsii]|uniref:RNI-like protein n=1 Tax=Linnemannia gamsii TaxID=64522 RepID=A0ABQ7KB17_9FUNG|nr:hypothetical protein BGZ96_000115 [Linnemannia gamsii]
MAVIQLITSSSPYLKRIDLTECRLLTNLTVQVIARLCNQLEELSLQGCGLVTDDVIEEVALNCTRLHRINIGQCQRAGDKSLEALRRASGRMTQLDPTSRVRTRNAQLTKLGVAGCRGITYSGLSAVMEQLNAAGSTVQDGYLQPQQRSSLVSLEFTCPAVKPPTVENVNGLSMSTGTTATSTRALSQASRFFRTLPATLEEISIHDAYTLSHNDIIALVDQVGKGLKVLRFDHANAINSETLGHVLATCPNLTILSIPRASRLDDSGVFQLIGAKCAGSLVELDLSACHSLTDGCLTALAKCAQASSTTTSTLHENDKGKGIQEQPNPCLFPNLQRLDLSYNDKMTLGGIIPLVMSLKNLCALDVSFCGDGVTRSWSSTLESLRPILNPNSTSAMDSTGIDHLLGDVVIESDHSDDEEFSTSSLQQYSLQQEQQLQYPPTGIPPPQQYGLSSQNLQRFMNGVAPLVNPSRLGLGRYVGPLLNRAASSNTTSNYSNSNINNDIVPQHPQQYPGQGGTSLDRSPFGNRQIQAAAAHVTHNNQMLNQHNANANNATAAVLFANSMPFAALSAEMMNHPVMTAIRVGAATIGGINNGGGGPPVNGNGAGGGVAHGGVQYGGNNAISQNLFDSINNETPSPPPVYHGNRRLSVTSSDLGPGVGAGAGAGGNRAAGRGGVRHHHRHHYQHSHYHHHHRRSPLSNAAATGHCEISAWGLIKLREEWASVI